jgi:hypothetical protein
MEHPLSQSESRAGYKHIIENPPLRRKHQEIITRILHGTVAGSVAYFLKIATNLLPLNSFHYYEFARHR